MSTPPDAPPPPQGSYGPPPGQDPYGPPPGQVQPYGQPGHGQPGQGYDGRPDPGPGTDVVSVLGLVFAVLLAPVGLVLSIVGIARTRDGRRKGRGFAIAGIIVSVVLSLLVAALVVALAAFGSWVTTELESTVQELEQQGPGFSEELDEGLGVPSSGPGGLDELLEELLPSVPSEVDPAAAVPLGETVEVDAFDVTVTGVDLDAGEALVAEGALEPDGRYVLVTADVTNTSAEPQDVYLGLDVSYLSAQGTGYDEFTCDATFDGQASGLDPVEPGATTTAGWCLVVPEAEAGGGVVVVSPALDLTGDGTAVWSQQ